MFKKEFLQRSNLVKSYVDDEIIDWVKSNDFESLKDLTSRYGEQFLDDIQLIVWVMGIDLQYAKELKDMGFFIDISASGLTPLIIAVRNNKIDVARWLIENGADVNYVGAFTWTPLMFSVQNGDTHNIAMVKLLLERGANVHIKDGLGWTALLRASHFGYVEAVKALLKAGARVNTKNNKGVTALMLAATGGRLKVASVLLKNGINVNYKNHEGWTALMLAVDYDRFNLAHLLIKHGADVSLCNNDGNTALDILLKYKNKDVVKLLRDKQGMELSSWKEMEASENQDDWWGVMSYEREHDIEMGKLLIDQQDKMVGVSN